MQTTSNKKTSTYLDNFELLELLACADGRTDSALEEKKSIRKSLKKYDIKFVEWEVLHRNNRDWDKGILDRGSWDQTDTSQKFVVGHAVELQELYEAYLYASEEYHRLSKLYWKLRTEAESRELVPSKLRDALYGQAKYVTRKGKVVQL